MSLDDTSLENEEVIETTMADEIAAAAETILPQENETETQREERIRDASGRFAPKEQIKEPEQAVEIKQEPEQKPIYDLKNAGFKKEELEKLETLPDDIKAALVERDARYHNGLRQLKERAQIADTFADALSPHAEYLKALQVSPQDFIPSLVNAEKTLRLGSIEQKVNIVQRLLNDYQIPVEAVTNTPFDPRLAQLQQEIEYRDRYINNVQRASQSSEQQQLQEGIAQWAQDKEYFEEVRLDMAFLLESGKAADLDSAYKMALRLNDSVFEKTQAAQLDLKRQQQAREADKRARQAMGSSVQVRGNSSGLNNAPVFNSISEELAYIADQRGY